MGFVDLDPLDISGSPTRTVERMILNLAVALLANSPTPVSGISNLLAMNIDPELAARDYRERTVGPYCDVLPPHGSMNWRCRPTSARRSCTIAIASAATKTGVEYHPAYREIERIGFGEFGIHAMSRRPGVLGWPAIAPPLAKYTLQYLFAQAEFALLCPLSVTNSSVLLI